MSTQNVLNTQRYGIYFRMLDRMLIDQVVPDCPICGYHLTVETDDQIGLSDPQPRLFVTVRCTNSQVCGMEVSSDVIISNKGPLYQSIKARRLNRTGGVLPPGEWPEPRPQTETPAEGRANRAVNM